MRPLIKHPPAKKEEQLELVLDLYPELSSKVRIDRDRLDVAVEEQAHIFLEVCEQHVRACSLRDEAKDQLARKDAELARAARKEIEAAGQRATEALVTDAIMLNPVHINAAEHAARLKYEADRWWALREAFDQRMRMIRELVNLYASGYYGSAGAVNPSNTVRDSLAARAKEKLHEHRQARKQ